VKLRPLTIAGAIFVLLALLAYVYCYVPLPYGPGGETVTSYAYFMVKMEQAGLIGPDPVHARQLPPFGVVIMSRPTGPAHRPAGPGR
jgi:hypothetical protein